MIAEALLYLFGGIIEAWGNACGMRKVERLLREERDKLRANPSDPNSPPADPPLPS